MYYSVYFLPIVIYLNIAQTFREMVTYTIHFVHVSSKFPMLYNWLLQVFRRIIHKEYGVDRGQFSFKSDFGIGEALVVNVLVQKCLDQKIIPVFSG